MNKKYKYLMKNVGLLTISNFASKLLSFFLVPLYTSVLTTEEYGNYDLVYTTNCILVPVLTINIIEALLRFTLDKNKDAKEVFFITLKISARSCILFGIFIIFNYISNFIPALNEYLLFFILFYITSLVLQMLQNLARGVDKISDLSISGFIQTFFCIALNIFFLLVLKLGINGYFLANIVSSLIASIYLTIRINIVKYISYKKTNKKLEKEMLDYSKPLIWDSIGWWTNNLSDRYIVTAICGLAANGIYSVAYKLPSALSMIQSIFNQAWTLSSVKAYNKKDEDGFFKNVYVIYNLMMVICCSVLIIGTKIFAAILYKNEFYNAWKYTPFLMISIVFGALSGILTGLFSAVKDTKVLSKTTIIGAVSNLILNIILTSIIGPIGAAIATAISTFLIWMTRMIAIKKYIDIKINLKKDLIVYLLLVIQAILLLVINNNIALYIIQIVLLIIEICFYLKDIKNLVIKLKRKIYMIISKKGDMFN